GSEGEARDPAYLGRRVQRLQVVERGRRVRKLSHALVVFALAAPDAAEIEPQAGEADVVEGIMETVDHLVVHRPPVLRMGVEDDRQWRVPVLLGMVAAFQPTVGTGEDDLGHGGW